ncbi:extracellular solute-binding protein family 5 (plasmid) [Rhizobium leguminosarum bv. trifolii WSM2304]|uniref:Extracellular solute-binding protein family 5 n=1 Tax=Rhizobium leguminosarum bv. trifolii (strain WSM2304) TaxID=395492 RepID=A0ABF7R012_RHILW|nr:ABC transporter substrate-binding protein [Rhizobium leguminosarum]ACI59647.1 extracellular solute-binding protein family 5 [Rhizobium leguminosarum bv. trifolii WSM2304]
MQYLNRRRFMQLSAAVAASGFAPGFARAEGKRGGHLRVGLAGGSSQDTLDQLTYVSDATWIFSSNVRNNLVEIDELNQQVPGLAERWEVSPDATRFSFFIRKGVTFHSGKTLTADDVVASLNIHRGETSQSPAKEEMRDVVDIKADGSRVDVTFSTPNIDFLSLVTTFNFGILPVADGKIDRLTKDGTGPYMLESFEPGQSIILKRNPNYWKPEAGFFDTAEVTFIEDDAARMNAIRTGLVDVVNKVDLKTASVLKRVKGIRVEDIKTEQFNSFAMMIDTAPFNDNNIRLALKYGVNREELVKKILLGYGSIGNDHPVGVTNKFFNSQIQQTEFDADKAKYYLKQAGLTRLDVSLSASDAGFPGAVGSSSLYQSSAAAAGININVVREPNDGFYENVWLKKPFATVFWGKLASVGLQFSQAYLPGATWNETHCNLPQVTELIRTARGIVDETKRGEIYHELQSVIHEQGGSIIPMFTNFVWAVRDNVQHGPNLQNDLTLDGLKCFQRWWFA